MSYLLNSKNKELKGIHLYSSNEFSKRGRLSLSESELHSLCHIKRNWSSTDFHVVQQGQEKHIVYFLYS